MDIFTSEGSTFTSEESEEKTDTESLNEVYNYETEEEYILQNDNTIQRNESELSTKNCQNEMGSNYNGDTSKKIHTECKDNSNPNMVNLKLFIDKECVNLDLNNQMNIQDVTDIVGDIFGWINNQLGLEMNGEVLNPEKKLDSLPQGTDITMKVIICTGNKVKSVKIALEDSVKFEDYFRNHQNASAQTKSSLKLYSQETQTPYFPLVDISTNTMHCKSVQVDHLLHPEDKILETKPYIPYEEIIKYENDQAIMIQKCIRRFLAQKRIIKMKKERDLMNLKRKLQMEEMTYDKLEAGIIDVLNKAYLRHDDFVQAYSSLTEWLKIEKKNIRNEHTGQKRRFAMKTLFEKEINCLRYIQDRKMKRREENEMNSKVHIIEKASEPTSRVYPKGNITKIEDEKTKLSCNFKDIYLDLKKNCKNEERLNVLKRVMAFLKSLNAPECTEETIKLAERECQMLKLGVKNDFLDGSRKRLYGLFLHISTDPEFNPGADRLSKEKTNVALLQCRICKELKTPEQFNVDILKGLTQCLSCTIRKELACSSLSLSPYKNLLDDISFSESKLGNQGGYVKLLKPSDLYYLVKEVWHGRSSLSEENDVRMLRFIRWNPNKPWSPWNCILFSENESELHLAINDVETFYGEHFIRKIKNRHLSAKLKFKDLGVLNARMKNRETIDRNRGVYHKISSQIINPKTKKLNPKYIVTEPISDLVFV